MSIFDLSLNDNLKTLNSLKKDKELLYKLSKKIVFFCKKKNSKILVCGNGGSGTDADHFVTELIVRFKKKRKAISAISLSSNPSVLTACANDFHFKYIFKRQIECLANENDCVMYISTSGNSQNLIEAAKYTKKRGIFSISLTGFNGGKLKNFSNVNYTVKSDSVARIQEAHIFILHYFCESIENEF
jgi:D-sedoheptulose 7-phosphate isomerase